MAASAPHRERRSATRNIVSRVVVHPGLVLPLLLVSGAIPDVECSNRLELALRASRRPNQMRWS